MVLLGGLGFDFCVVFVGLPVLFECLFNWFGCVVGFGLGCWLWVG